jgi:hypothetical protein
MRRMTTISFRSSPTPRRSFGTPFGSSLMFASPSASRVMSRICSPSAGYEMVIPIRTDTERLLNALRSRLFPRERIEPNGAVFRNQHLGLQLNAFSAAFFADKTLHAHGHVLLKAPTIGLTEVGMQRHPRVFVGEPDAMQRRIVTPSQATFGNAPGFLVELREIHARSENPDIMVDLLERVRIERLLLMRHFGVTDGSQGGTEVEGDQEVMRRKADLILKPVALSAQSSALP